MVCSWKSRRWYGPTAVLVLVFTSGLAAVSIAHADATKRPEATRSLDANLSRALQHADRVAFASAIESGADGESLGLDDQALLSAAATLDSEDGVRILVARGVPVDGLDRNRETALFAAAAAGSVRAGEALLALGASADVVVESRRGPSWTPLFIAAAEGRGEVVALLLSAPSTSAAGRGLSRVDATDRYGRTPLFYAAIHGQSSILQTLLTAGASAAHADAEGRTALDAATSAGRSDDAALLSIAAQTQTIDTGKAER